MRFLVQMVKFLLKFIFFNLSAKLFTSFFLTYVQLLLVVICAAYYPGSGAYSASQSADEYDEDMLRELFKSMRNEESEMDEGFFSWLSNLWKKVKAFVKVRQII